MTRGSKPEINGAELLDDTRDFIARFVAFPSPAALIATTLWAAMTHMVEHFHTTPRLALLSPEPGSGKTRVLEVLALLVRLPMLALNASAAAIFRTLAVSPRTLLFDEVDAIWTRRGKDSDSNEDLRALLNSGYRRGATIPRCVGPRHEVQSFPVYSPAALAGLGDLPDTLMTRSVIIRMRKRKRTEPIEGFRLRVHEPQALPLAERLTAWGEAVGERAGEAWPELPPGVEDRAAELWEPLIAVADAAGGHWPETARAACLELLKVAEDREVSLGVRLLMDTRLVFEDHVAMTTADLLDALNNLEEAPWGDLYGKPLDARSLARRLRPYEVRSTKVKIDGRSLQGYRREDLGEAWERYAPAPIPAEAEPPEPEGQKHAPATARLSPPAQAEPPEPPEPQSQNAVLDGTESATARFHSSERFQMVPEPATASGTQEKPSETQDTPKVPEVPDAQGRESAPSQAPPEVKRLHRLWTAGAKARWTEAEQEDLARIFSQPRASPADQERLIELAKRLEEPPRGAPL